MSDMVNHPPHYTSHPSGHEVIELTRLLPFGAGNALKYVLRRDIKGNPIQDLDKAVWYLTDSIENEVGYTTTPKMRSLAQRFMLGTENSYERSFINALCRNGVLTPLGWGPDYELARDLVGLLREDY